ncbi:abts-1 [Pristionchus pacificus]|uniref:Anion exchange protein n=1 Tax=Pristionchus pacificus TaxID=54126 RepID=A0A2A6BMW2_PRIPA|nr:abts-1 [Pristionchus pacificus]|eukprot:PDM67244.1 abts-1 [Pristionchus pacificus]
MTGGEETEDKPSSSSGAGGKRDSIWQAVAPLYDVESDETRQARRERRMSKRHDSIELASLAPGTRVMFLLKEKSELPALFTEMGELGGNEWRETARWVKFEEEVEQGGNRWSKPHVAALSLHALFQLRNCIIQGLFLNELEHTDLPTIVHSLVGSFIEAGDVEEDDRAELTEILNRRHVHQYEQARRSGAGGEKEGGFLSAVRSISDIGKSFSHGKNLAKSTEEAAKAGINLELPKVESTPRDMSKEGSSSDVSKGNTHFLKKLPAGVEASNVLIGENFTNMLLIGSGLWCAPLRAVSQTSTQTLNMVECLVDFLQHHICAFIRLKTAAVLGDLTEVPVPTRFIFVLLGPQGHAQQYREIGRAIATLMSDEIFHDVAFTARKREDLVDGIDEFLDQVTVLPPGEWDPTIRIEPPSQLPSQEKRKQVGKEYMDYTHMEEATGGASKDDAHEEEGHGNDPALKRTGKLFGGLMLDVKRKAPHYLSDFTDALNLQCVATICFMYFALLAPIVTFGGLLEEATHQRMAAMENLIGGALCGVLYHLFAGQPLTIIGSTGPVLVFETIVYEICSKMGIDYLTFRFWVHIWTGGIVMLMCITDASSLVSFITRFTEESFATLIAVIFIYEAIMKLLKIKGQLDVIEYSKFDADAICRCIPAEFNMTDTHREKVSEMTKGSTVAVGDYWVSDLIVAKSYNITMLANGPDYSMVKLDQCREMYGKFAGDGCYPLYDKLLMSIMLALGTFTLSMVLKKCRNSCYFPSRVRQIFSDFAVMIAICVMTAVDVLVGINTPKLNVPSSFRPTYDGRGWIIPLFHESNPLWTCVLAFIPALLACILIFMDQQITTVIVNRKENKLKKGCGYHLDLFILAILIIIVGWLGLPIYVAATVLSINHINSLKVESESKAPGEVAQFIGVREQRVTGIVTFLLIGLSVLMTGALGKIPMPVLYGVFLYMGIAALGGIQLFDRILLLLMPMKYQPDTIYIRHVPIKKIHLFTAFQCACLAMLWIVKSIKSTSILFPIMLVVMVAVRKAIEVFFTKNDLKYLDDPMPDFHLRKKEDQKRKLKDGEAIEIDLDENQATIHAVKTEAHLHIPMNSGNVIKIPLASLKEPSHQINISKEVNNSGMWKHIQQTDSKNSLNKMAPKTDKEDHAMLAQAEEDEDAIMIKVIRPSPHGSTQNITQDEQKPLLTKRDGKSGSPQDSP